MYHPAPPQHSNGSAFHAAGRRSVSFRVQERSILLSSASLRSVVRCRFRRRRGGGRGCRCRKCRGWEFCRSGRGGMLGVGKARCASGFGVSNSRKWLRAVGRALVGVEMCRLPIVVGSNLKSAPLVSSLHTSAPARAKQQSVRRRRRSKADAHTSSHKPDVVSLHRQHSVSLGWQGKRRRKLKIVRLCSRSSCRSSQCGGQKVADDSDTGSCRYKGLAVLMVGGKS